MRGMQCAEKERGPSQEYLTYEIDLRQARTPMMLELSSVCRYCP